MADDDVAERFAEIGLRIDTAMLVVTTTAGGERSGCMVGFHSQASIGPPQYAVWMSKTNHTFGLVDQADFFGVHLLHASQRSLAELFGGTTGDDVDKFERCEWTDGPGGVPLLAACPTRFVGRKVAMADFGGDHVGVILAPLDVTLGPRSTPLRLADVEDLTPGHAA